MTNGVNFTSVNGPMNWLTEEVKAKGHLWAKLREEEYKIRESLLMERHLHSDEPPDERDAELQLQFLEHLDYVHRGMGIRLRGKDVFD